MTSDLNLQQFRKALTYRQLSQSDLAEALDVSSSFISQVLNAKKEFPKKLVGELASILRLEPEFFYLTGNEQELMSEVSFRKLSRALKKEQNANEVQYAIFLEAVSQLAEHVSLPEVNLPEYCTLFRDYDESFIKEAAATCRQIWGMSKGPIDNLIKFVELNGVVVSRANWGSQTLSGFAFWAKDQRPYIFLNNENSYFRTRFDLAHELGHLILHKNYPVGATQKRLELLQRKEKEANTFASYFLMPPDSFPDEVLSDNLLYFVELKKRWKVSISAMIYNCHSVGRIDDNKKVSLYRLINYRKWNRKEPLDEFYEPEQPELLFQALKLIFNNNLMEPREFVKNLGLPPKELELLLNLPFGFLLENQRGNKILDIRLKNISKV